MADSIFKQIGSIIKNLVDTTKTELQANINAITPTTLGLGNVNNTSDADKPVSTATQTALNTKQDIDSRIVFDGAYVHTDNNYTTPEKNKLAGIEPNATADQTPAEIKTAYESNFDTNAFDNAAKSKLDGIEASAQVNTVTSVAGRIGNVTLNIADITVDGSIIPTDDVVYDLGSATHRFRDLWLSSNTIKMGDFGISVTENGTIATSSLTNPDATVDILLKDVDIGVLVQGYNANTVVDGAYVHTDNNYTTPEKTKVGYLSVTSSIDLDETRTKLAGIESGATADQTAPEILTLVKTVDGVGSGLDADLLDGQEGSYYTNYTDTKIAELVASSPATLDTLNELAAALGNDANFATTMTTQLSTKLNAVDYNASDVLTKLKTVDGTNSGLDADLLDGQQGSYYQPASTALTTSTTFTGDVSGTYNNTVVSQAAKLTTPRTISLSGDVTGSVSFDGSTNATITTTISADSVALGVDTTGNYVAVGAVSGNGLSGSASGEGTTFTVTSNATNLNNANTIVFRDATGNFSAGTITANLTGAVTGNASTATKLATARTLSVSGGATGSVSFDGSSNADIAITVTNNSHTHTSANISDATNLNTASTIVKRDASGNFTAGTITAALVGNATTASALATARTITLAGDLTGSATFDGSSNITISAEVANDSHTHDLSYIKTSGGVITGNLTVNGALYATSLTETSSIKFKENVQPLVDPMVKISALQGVSYTWKETGVADIGFIAEEVDKIIPEIVSKNDAGEVSGMNYGKLTALLVEAIKIQQAQIAELQKLIK